jgi:hypothetical protein
LGITFQHILSLVVRALIFGHEIINFGKGNLGEKCTPVVNPIRVRVRVRVRFRVRVRKWLAMMQKPTYASSSNCGLGIRVRVRD